jgi:hypothetical protein
MPRYFRIITELQRILELDLSGMKVLTEAGSGPFLYSSIIAAVAGARGVVAIAPDSQYGTHGETRNGLRKTCAEVGIAEQRINVVASREDVPVGMDVILNLGFVRPIDRTLLTKASSRAVVSYMCEAWEYRHDDLDLKACRELAIPVSGVNENFQGLGVFDACGQLAIKMLFEAGIEVAGCRIGVVSKDPFGVVIEKALTNSDASVVAVRDVCTLTDPSLENMDALVVASYGGELDVFDGSRVTPQRLRQLNPDIVLVQFAGCFDPVPFIRAGVKVFPGIALPPYRMAKTLASLGIRPVLALHALGLKVGELLFRSKNFGSPYGRFDSLVQLMN